MRESSSPASDAHGATAASSSARLWFALSTGARVGAVTMASVLMGLFVVVSAQRASYEFDLEWMEGGMVEHVARLLAGEPLYVAPGIEFVTYIYNPLFYVVAAPFAWVFGVGHLALRLVSIVATLATFASIFVLVKRETRALAPAIVAAGTYAGTYPQSGGWFDIARVDSLCIALCLGAFIASRFARTGRGLLLAATLTFLAFETKQSALAIVPSIALYVSAVHGLRQGLWYVVPVAVLIGMTAVAFHFATGGWYSFYAFHVPAGFPRHPEKAIDFWIVELLAQLPLPIALTLFFLAAPADRRTGGFYALFTATFVGISYTVRLHEGSYLNDLMPAFVALSVLAGLGLHKLLAAAGTAPHPMHVFGHAIVLLHLIACRYPSDTGVPSQLDREEGHRFLRAAARYPDDVLVWHHGHVTERLGKPSFFSHPGCLGRHAHREHCVTREGVARREHGEGLRQQAVLRRLPRRADTDPQLSRGRRDVRGTFGSVRNPDGSAAPATPRLRTHARAMSTRAGQLGSVIACTLFAGLLVRTAWLCDDAYITFRTVENAVAGHG